MRTGSGTTRNPDREELLKSNGAVGVFIDDGDIAPQVQARVGGFDKVLELIGTTTRPDSLRCVKEHGVVCMAGIVGNKWPLDNFAPMASIPSASYLTIYNGGVGDFMAMPFQELVDEVAAGEMTVTIGKVFRLDDIVEAHRLMESNKAGGKIVVLT